MLNVYPFFAYVETLAIDINYALFTITSAGIYDNASKLMYMNLLDAMEDTIISTLKRLGYLNMLIIIVDTGSPNGGSTRNRVNV
jgi:hypothetical protein